jgi:hypothetical protein
VGEGSNLQFQRRDGLHPQYRGPRTQGSRGHLWLPLITQIADPLCRLIEDEKTRLAAPLFLVDAHIDAIAVAVRDRVRSDDDPIGRALVSALDERVREFGW